MPIPFGPGARAHSPFGPISSKRSSIFQFDQADPRTFPNGIPFRVSRACRPLKAPHFSRGFHPLERLLGISRRVGDKACVEEPPPISKPPPSGRRLPPPSLRFPSFFFSLSFSSVLLSSFYVKMGIAALRGCITSTRTWGESALSF